MWPYYIVGGLLTKILVSKTKKYLLQYKSLKALKEYGASINCPYVDGENVDKYRERLIKMRDKKLSI